MPIFRDHVVLGHARPKLLRTYMPTLPLGEAREALQRWGDELERILGVDRGITGSDAYSSPEAGTSSSRVQPTLDFAEP